MRSVVRSIINGWHSSFVDAHDGKAGPHAGEPVQPAMRAFCFRGFSALAFILLGILVMLLGALSWGYDLTRGFLRESVRKRTTARRPHLVRPA